MQRGLTQAIALLPPSLSSISSHIRTRSVRIHCVESIIQAQRLAVNDPAVSLSDAWITARLSLALGDTHPPSRGVEADVCTTIAIVYQQSRKLYLVAPEPRRTPRCARPAFPRCTIFVIIKKCRQGCRRCKGIRVERVVRYARPLHSCPAGSTQELCDVGSDLSDRED